MLKRQKEATLTNDIVFRTKWIDHSLIPVTSESLDDDL